MLDYKGMLQMEVEGLYNTLLREDYKRDDLLVARKNRYHELLEDKLRVIRVIFDSGKYESWAAAKDGLRALALNYSWGEHNRIIKVL